jgi:hypothetical protein
MKIKKKKDWMKIKIKNKAIYIWKDAGDNIVVEVERNGLIVETKTFVNSDDSEE